MLCIPSTHACSYSRDRERYMAVIDGMRFSRVKASQYKLRYLSLLPQATCMSLIDNTRIGKSNECRPKQTSLPFVPATNTLSIGSSHYDCKQNGPRHAYLTLGAANHSLSFTTHIYWTSPKEHKLLHAPTNRLNRTKNRRQDESQRHYAHPRMH